MTESKSLFSFPDALVKRVANVLEWGVTTGPSHPDATFEKFAEQVLKVIDQEGYLRPEPQAQSYPPTNYQVDAIDMGADPPGLTDEQPPYSGELPGDAGRR